MPLLLEKCSALVIMWLKQTVNGVRWEQPPAPS